MPAKNAFEKQGEKLVPVRKSKRAPKRHVLDEEFDEDDDAEIRYLKKLKNAKVGRYKDLETESTKYQHNLPRIPKKFNSESAVEGIDYEDELLSDGEPEGKKKKKQKDLSDIQIESQREMTLTTRQRALLSGKDASSPGVSQIEFPDGLPLPPRSEYDVLSIVNPVGCSLGCCCLTCHCLSPVLQSKRRNSQKSSSRQKKQRPLRNVKFKMRKRLGSWRFTLLLLLFIVFFNIRF